MPKTLEPPPKASEASQPYEEDGMVVIDDVPVFDEHEADDGTTYGPEELQAIADNCNRRIRDTGDYVALTDGHTQDPEDPKSIKNAKTGMLAQPEVLGLAGPFRVGEIGEENPRKCILARFRYFNDKADRAMRLPRRSVEVWQEKDPKQRYFDPIALLGSEAPRRDLGMLYRYSKGRNGASRRVPVVRYSAAFPGGGPNTFVPGTDRDKNSKEPTMAIAPEDIQAIVAAISETDWAKWAQRQMANESMASDSPEAMQKYMAEDPDMQAMKRYQEGGDMAGAKTHMASMAPEARERMKKCYGMAEGGPDAPQKEFYAKCEEPDADDKKEPEAEKYRKENASLVARYNRLEASHRTLQAKVDAAEQKACRAERYSKLTEKREAGYILDPDVEIEECVKMSPAEWDVHLNRIERYARAPMGTVLPLVKGLPGNDLAARTATAQKATQIAREKGIPWNDAYQQASAKN